MTYFNRFDICEAYYRYHSEYHTGQGSKLYALSGTFARLKYQPNLNRRGMTENVLDIYLALVKTKGRYVRDRRA